MEPDPVVVERNGWCGIAATDISGPLVLEIRHEGSVLKEAPDIREPGIDPAVPGLQTVVDEDVGDGLVGVVDLAEEGDEVSGCSDLVRPDREDLFEDEPGGLVPAEPPAAEGLRCPVERVVVPGTESLDGLVIKTREEVSKGETDALALLEEVVGDRFPTGMGEPDDETRRLFAVVPGCTVAGFVGVPEGDGVGVGEQVEPVGPKCLDDPLFKEDPVGVEHRGDRGVRLAEPGENPVLPFSHGRPPPGGRGLDRSPGFRSALSPGWSRRRRSCSGRRVPVRRWIS